ncbi:MAG: ribonuclease E/G [Defluviitaleaceae bacterium]|nr:ribonuclease E/G [Defluviitaleaceae bacterium]
MKKIYIQHRADGFVTALAENGKLIELIRDYDDGQNAFVAGNIYAGVVKQINTGFLFLDVGLERQAFLDTRDARERGLFDDHKLAVKQGDTLVVQVLRDAVGEKGPTVTSCVSFTGRYVVMSKSNGFDRINISRKITDAAENVRLKSLGERLVPQGFSAIMRSASENRDEDNIVVDLQQVMLKFEQCDHWQYAKGPAALFAESSIIKTLHEIVGDDIDEIVVDDLEAVQLFEGLALNIRHYNEDVPIFEGVFLKAQIDKLRDKRVWLKSGGFIVIEQTEACIVIDVNSGKLIAKKGDAALKVNMEAAKEIAYQARLRNLAGIIIVDFIAMRSAEDANSLTDFLRAEMAKDRIPATVVGMTALGLMEITRKRTRNSSGNFGKAVI